ncbi:condensin-2 complex subunit H2-like isoform X3 [Zootermopsis nevadensis]|uniref:condensin-2 complex subunit H2-like isoform X3 n=1 Tax=Zootermopsis nevadensis TaxID=136037 RepID=UPI000B8EE489|nr:condensin-2 complex subunit H2-like isoform X3 [Zootermopsis nevadensis]
MRSDHVNSRILLKIEELVKPLNKLPKAWNDHLAKHLDEYMECIEQLSRDESLGLTAINFVQAGLMVENTTKVYALNVDYLWQFMTQVLEVLRMNNSSNNNNKRRSEASVETPESSEKYSRRKKRAVCEDFEEIIPNVIDPDMKTEERNEPIKPLPLQRHIIAKTDWKRQKHSYHIYDVEGDTVVSTDYSVMLQTSRQGKLQLNMLKEITRECSEEHIRPENFGELIHVLELLVQELSQSDAGCSTNEDEDNDLAEETELTPDGIFNLPSLEAPTEHDSVEPPEHPTLSSLPVTPPPSPEPIKRSASDLETPEGIKRSISDAESEKEVCAAGLSARRQGKREHLVTVPCDPWEPERGTRERPLKRKQAFKLPCDIRLLKPDEKKRKSGHEEKVKLMVEYNGTKMLCTYVIHSCFPLYPDFKQFCLQEIKQKTLLLQNQPKLYSVRALEELHHHLSKECDEDFFGFEDYEPEFGEEEGFRGFPEEEEPEDDENNENYATDPDSTATQFLVNESHENAAHPPSSKDILFENNVFGQTDSSEDINLFQEQMEADIARRVAEWEKYIRPKLKVAHDRGHFDIHSVGTEILSSFPQSSAKVTLRFEQFAADKPREDIPRYFLAALQLANTSNIEISQSTPGHLSMDCMEMTLLSPVRHHEALEDYKAPSQGDRRKRFISRAGVCDSDSDGDSIASSSTCRHKRNKR